MELTAKDLNPIKRQRIRETVQMYRVDTALLSLTDDELDGALGLVVAVEGGSVSNISRIIDDWKRGSFAAVCSLP